MPGDRRRRQERMSVGSLAMSTASSPKSRGFSLRCRLDSYAKLDILRLVTGMRIKVIRRPAIELVALTEFAPDYNTDCQRRDACRYPADIAQERTPVVGHAIDGVLDVVADFAERTRELHGWMINQSDKRCVIARTGSQSAIS